MEGHKIVLSDDFLQDFSGSKRTSYTKTQAAVSDEAEKHCREWEHKLARCLNSCQGAISASYRASEAAGADGAPSAHFRKVLECTKEFREYEACIRKEEKWDTKPQTDHGNTHTN
ncbi:phosphate transporter, putative [Babesia ovata]|uniref:Phosphate transporter, putative n=1 Tax=Babesia ovata TaxID=189622 RepID=A0A2H6K713_9APIC|nr:phosphate transporter, putative [Babesia ovata]GBE58784.1 phosphate transporter, putative [Babesia ovata]